MRIINTYVESYYFVPPQGLDSDVIRYEAESLTDTNGIYFMTRSTKIRVRNAKDIGEMRICMDLVAGDVVHEAVLDVADYWYTSKNIGSRFDGSLDEFRRACLSWARNGLQVELNASAGILSFKCPAGGAIYALDGPIAVNLPGVVVAHLTGRFIAKVNEVVYLGKSDDSKFHRAKIHEQWRRIGMACGDSLDPLVYFLKLKTEALDCDGEQRRSAFAGLDSEELLRLNEMYFIHTLKPSLNEKHVDVVPSTMIDVVKKAADLGFGGYRMEIELSGELGAISPGWTGLQNRIEAVYPLINRPKDMVVLGRHP